MGLVGLFSGISPTTINIQPHLGPESRLYQGGGLRFLSLTSQVPNAADVPPPILRTEPVEAPVMHPPTTSVSRLLHPYFCGPERGPYYQLLTTTTEATTKHFRTSPYFDPSVTLDIDLSHGGKVKIVNYATGEEAVLDELPSSVLEAMLRGGTEGLFCGSEEPFSQIGTTNGLTFF